MEGFIAAGGSGDGQVPWSQIRAQSRETGKLSLIVCGAMGSAIGMALLNVTSFGGLGTLFASGASIYYGFKR